MNQWKPYENVPVEQWYEVTSDLINQHPLREDIVDFCLKSWQSILHGKINTYLNMHISEMSISPQATGALLHDVIPEYISKKTSNFRKGIGSEKDVICEDNDFYSFEIKTSSQKSIFGNRSYTKTNSGKSKSGYYLTINFEKIDANDPKFCEFKWDGLTSQTGSVKKVRLVSRQGLQRKQKRRS